MGLTYRLSAAYAVWLAVLCLLVEWSGALRIVLSPTVAWLFVAVAAATASGFVYWAARTMPRPLRAFPSPSSRAPAAAWVVAVLAVAAYLLLWVPAYCRPDTSWDGMTYHLPTIHYWAAKGHVHWIQAPPEAGSDWQSFTDALLNGYPKTGEAVGFVLARLSGGKLVNAFNLAFLPLAMLGIAALARELGAARGPAAAAGALFALVPTNVGQAASTYVDTAFACAVVSYLSFFFLQVRAVLASPNARLPLPLAVASGAALGLALGVKGPALGLAALSLFVLAVAIAIRLRKRTTRLVRRLRPTLLALVAMGGLALAVGGFWYARNAIVTGNPMHPFEIKVAGRVLFPGVPVDVMIAETANTPSFMREWSNQKKILYTWRQSGRLEWPIDATIEHNEQGYGIEVPQANEPAWPRSIRYNDPRSGGLGFLWLYGGLPSLVAVAGIVLYRTRRGARTERLRAMRNVVALGLFLATWAVFFKIKPMGWWARYTLWLHAAGLSALAVVMHHTLTGLARKRLFAFAATPLIVGVMAVAFFEYAYALKWDHTMPYFVGPARINRRSSVAEIWHALTTTKDNGISAIYADLGGTELARDALSGDAIVAVSPLSIGNGPVVGQLSMPVGRRQWIMMSPDVGNDADAAAAFVTKYLPRYVVWDVEANGTAHVLERTATRSVWLRSMKIFEFGDSKALPPVIHPK